MMQSVKKQDIVEYLKLTYRAHLTSVSNPIQADGRLKIEYCPTKSMRADGFTKKPLQGKEFIEFRDYILGYVKD